MSRQGARRSEDSASPDIPLEVSRAIGREATLVAQRLGLNRVRVRRILDRMARAFPENLRFVGTGRDGRALPIWSALGAPSLEEALRYLPAERALTLFERAD